MLPASDQIHTVVLNRGIEHAVASLDGVATAEVHLDCRSLAVVRSDDLSQLITLRLKLQRNNQQLVLTHINDEVMKTLELTRLDRLFEIAETVA